MNREKIKNFFGKIGPSDFVFCFILILVSCLPAISLIPTTNFKLDYLSYKLIDYNKVPGNSSYDSPILNIKKLNSTGEYCHNLFYNFHYNLLCNGGREIVENKTCLYPTINGESFELDLKLTIQPTYSISSINGGSEEIEYHHIDFGQYYSYFPDIDNRHRGSADTSFIYISDTLADKLINIYGITGNRIEAYKQLVNDERYCFLPMKIDDNNIVPLSINNILYSSFQYGQSKRMTSLYGDFGLIWPHRIKQYLDFSFDIDLKTNPFGNKKIVNQVIQLGYSADNSVFSIIDSKAGIYSYNKELSSYLNDAISFKHNIACYILFVSLLILVFLLVLVAPKIFFKKVNKVFCTIVYLIFFVIYGIIASYTYIYPLFSIAPLVILVVMCLNFIINKLNRRNIRNYEHYVEIHI